MKKVREVRAVEMEEIKIIECKNGEYRIFARCFDGIREMILMIDTENNTLAVDFKSKIENQLN